MKINEKIVLFKQDMFYYKLNLYLPNLIWTGTKGCKKKHLLNPQWLRNVKDRKYSFYRIDTIFSKNKYKSIRYINNGGWHFTNIKTAEEIQYKLKSYLHHREFDENPLNINQISEIIKNKKAIYNLNVDKSENKFETMEGYFEFGESQGLTHLVLDNSNLGNRYLQDIFQNEQKYSFLNKIYDSSESGYNVHIKVFEINYNLIPK